MNPHPEWTLGQSPSVRPSLDQQFARFLRRKRGERPCAQFARKLGISASTLHRLENGQQGTTLQRFQQILGRLKCLVREDFSFPAPKR